MAAFDLALGLGRGRVEEFDAVEVERSPELGEGVGGVGVEEGVEAHIEGQRQTVDFEDAGEEARGGPARFRRDRGGPQC